MELQSLNLNTMESLRISWSTLLKTVVDEESWEEILMLPSKISICNRYKEMQYNILHNVYISPFIYSKYKPGVSPNCPKCKSILGTRIHCLWECKNIELFWQAICAEISMIIEQPLSPSPLACLLGLIPDCLKAHKEIVQFLLMLARKAIMVKWVGADPPSAQLWKSLISDVITLEQLRYCINGKHHLIISKWERVLNFFQMKSTSI